MSGLRDVIGHVTTWLPVGHFLLVVLWNGGAENAGVEKAGVDSNGGKCRSDNGWKAVRTEKYIKISTTQAKHDIVIITAKTQKPSQSRLTCMQGNQCSSWAHLFVYVCDDIRRTRDYIAIYPKVVSFCMRTRTSCEWRMKAEPVIWNAARSDATDRQTLSATCSSWVYVYICFIFHSRIFHSWIFYPWIFCPYRIPHSRIFSCPFETKPLSLTVSEIVNGECDAMVDMTLNDL